MDPDEPDFCETINDDAPSGWKCMDCGVPLPGPDHDHECPYNEEESI